jgi:hypothetical protein
VFALGWRQSPQQLVRPRAERASAHSDIWIWIGAAFAAALVLALAVLVATGFEERGLFIALRVTARFSFVLFWLAYASGALAQLYGPIFAPFASRRRQFGLAFAAAHVVHLGLVIWLYRVAVSKPIPDSSAVIFSVGFFWIFVLVLLSVNSVRYLVPMKMWRALQTLGLEYIAYLFFADFYRPMAIHQVAYLPFAGLVLVGLSLRMTAAVKNYVTVLIPKA